MGIYAVDADEDPRLLRQLLGRTDFVVAQDGDRKIRRLGIFFGYPRCCIRHFIRAGRRKWWHPKSWRPEKPERHPTRGHLMCPRCSKAPAPLPKRLADRSLLALMPDDEHDYWIFFGRLRV